MGDSGVVVLVIAIVIALAVLPFLLKKGLNAGYDAANRNIFNKDKAAASDHLTGQVLQIDTAASAADVIEAIRGGVTQASTFSTFGSDLVETLREEDTLGYVYGSKLGSVFTVIISTQPSNVSGAETEVSVTTVEWALDSGIATRLEKLQRLHDEVLDAVLSLDSAAQVSYRPAPPATKKR